MNYAIISGEGENGTIDELKGTAEELAEKLEEERCNGDRWAWAAEIIGDETAEEAIDRARSTGGKIE